MKNKSVVIVCGDPESTFNEILIKTLKNKVLSVLPHGLVILIGISFFIIFIVPNENFEANGILLFI